MKDLKLVYGSVSKEAAENQPNSLGTKWVSNIPL
ncbi:hypothetical protein FNJ60_05225 [Bacteroides pyogenes]|uniref:Uncharacterized protein n=1 Tax=Bacteroides pyogenes TaxID=310300 RepID=A0A5D3FQ42_9BACE|nr:hypothetical protein FNJ60_05225 [Bacteroides pyogenes]TYK50138.1 hypothetical protein FNG97_04780 [Bacteroides pyogenes]